MRTLRLVGVAAVLAALTAGTAAAGPIGWSHSPQRARSSDTFTSGTADDVFFWSYSSRGAQSGGYSLTGTPLMRMVNEDRAERRPLEPYSGFSPRISTPGESPPELVANVTLTDQESNASATFDVSYSFSTDVEGGYLRPFVHKGFQSTSFDLGGNTYVVQSLDGDDQRLCVSVSRNWDAPAPTPEPGTLGLAAVGLAGVGLARLRSRRTAKSRGPADSPKLAL